MRKISETDNSIWYLATIGELTTGTESVSKDGHSVEYKVSRNRLIFGVNTLNGKLILRPTYQRNFVWNIAKQRRLIKTILDNDPINPLIFGADDNKIWEDEKTNFESTCDCVDGQQRLITMCEFRHGFLDMSDGTAFSELSPEVRDRFLNYEIELRFMKFKDYDHKIRYFEVINIQGTEATKQEIRNATYDCEFVSDLKRWFGLPKEGRTENSKIFLHDNGLVTKYLKCNGDTVNRQELVEWALFCNLVLTDDEVYEMFKNKNPDMRQPDTLSFYEKNNYSFMEKKLTRYLNVQRELGTVSCSEVKNNVLDVLDWVNTTFNGLGGVEMRNVKNWPFLYRKYHEHNFDSAYLYEAVSKGLDSSQVHWKYNLPEFHLEVCSHPDMSELDIYMLSHKLLSLGDFIEEIKLFRWEEQEQHCAVCDEFVSKDDMIGHHVIPYAFGGTALAENCKIVCSDCHHKIHTGFYFGKNLKFVR